MNLNDKFLIADVFDVVSKRNGKVISVDEDNSSVSLAVKTSIKEIKAGQGNKLFCTLRSKDSIEVVTESPKLSLQNLAETLGTEIVTGSGEAITKSVRFKIDDTLVHTLERVPKNPDELVLTIGDKLLTKDKDYTYAEGKITMKTDGGSKVGEVVTIPPYVFATNEKASRITIDATSFPEGVELWLTTFAINKTDNKEGYLQFRFYNAVADGSLDFATKSERDAVTNKITYKIISGDDDNYGELIFIPREDATAIPGSFVGKMVVGSTKLGDK